ncbi:uncharacterized protein LOC124281046 [Haliotis rubra]|uniref:uncharacterized protein LOC124281046 n=1 Tax=Haliotis rubra TaxID=36100 RepID=UPI001EE58D95|nr:uncharacterized protein LOC124281046 [Haliotis rubra]
MTSASRQRYAVQLENNGVVQNDEFIASSDVTYIDQAGCYISNLMGQTAVVNRFKKTTEQRIVERFPNLFLTRNQLQQRVNLTTRYTPVNSYVRGADNCRLNCLNETTARFGKQSSGYIWHHACCQTQIFYRAEDTLTNIFGHVKRIAQFKDHKQYFKREVCRHVLNFGYGVCSQNVEYVTAVTVDGDDGDMGDISDELHHDEDKYQIDWVRVNGSCKCLNRGRHFNDPNEFSG